MKYAVIAILICSTAYAGTHTVRRNDSLWKIAKRVYGLTYNIEIDNAWKKIAKANGITRPNKIRAGQRLIIPDEGTSFEDIIPKGYVLWKVIENAKVTAYCRCSICCKGFADNKTSIGRNARITDGCGVDPSVIPYGTLIDIPGLGIRKADDCGSAMKKSTARGIYHIDVRMSNHRVAKKWGKPILRIRLYKEK